jgi:drug/metabolite transporter (DMT)-like permease
MTANRPAGWRVDLGLVAVALIWGFTFVLVKRALDDISTLLFLTLRFIFAAIVLAAIFRGEIRKANLRRSIRGGAIAGFFLFSGYILQTFGLKYTTPAKAGFLTGLYIPLVPLIGTIVYRKIPQTSELLGIVAAFFGMALLTTEGSALKVGGGDLLVIACAVVYAFHILVLGRFAPGSNVGVLTVMQIITGSILGSATCWWVEPVRVQWTPTVWIALGVTSLLATALAFYLQTWAQQYSSPTRTALIFSTEPLFAWLASFLLTGEVLSGRGVAGAALILAGILLVELKPLRIGQHQWS